VTDASGLGSRYDFTLTYLPEVRPGPTGPTAGQYPRAPNTIKAVGSQFAMRLEKGNVSVKILVIDQIEKTPVEN
jgi:uncharacterized protein (TIGR03435 family)